MTRRHREDEPGAIHHVTTRGNNRRRIRWDDVDSGAWERTLARVVRHHGWQVLAYALLDNHFHLLIRTPEGGLSAGMCLLNGGFARQMNQRHDRRDHLFGRRFWSKRAETDGYVLRSARYVAWNPVRAGLAASPEEYRWSSHRALAGLAHPPSFLATGELLGLFSADPARARTAYLDYVHDSRVPVPGTVTEL